MTKQLERMAGRLAALGHPVRLAILRRVVQGPEEGTPAGEIQQHVKIPASTLSHHLATLADADLITADRQGTFLRYRAQFAVLRQLSDYVWEDCCKGGSCCP